jgi:hypothetical protein
VREFAFKANFSSPFSSANNNLVVLLRDVRNKRERKRKIERQKERQTRVNVREFSVK